MRSSHDSLVAVGMAALLAAAGCGSADAFDFSRSAPPASASLASQGDLQSLIEAAGNTQHFPHRFNVDAGVVTISGEVDPQVGTTAEVTIFGQDASLRLIGAEDLYISGLPSVEQGRFMHVDLTRLPTPDLVALGYPEAYIGLLAGVTYAEEVTAGEYQGVIDTRTALGRLPDSEARRWLEGMLGSEGTAEIPFTAQVDNERLTALTLQVPVVWAGLLPEVNLTLTNFGEPVTVIEPAAESVVEAPEELYRFVGFVQPVAASPAVTGTP